MTGEGSPYYLFHPHGPARAAAAVPGARVIVMLRDPVERAYSHYQQEYARGFEDAATFEAALDLEPSRLEGERERMLADPAYDSRAYQHHAYVTRGEYADQLTAWRERFPAERMLVIGVRAVLRRSRARATPRCCAFSACPIPRARRTSRPTMPVPPPGWRTRHGRGCGRTSPSPTGGWRSSWA